MASSSSKLFILALFFCAFSFSFSFATDVSYDERALVIDGERRIILSGAVHYPRSTPEMWPSLISKAKEGGLNAIETYVFWNAHEPLRRQYDFSGKNDLVRFIKTIQDQGLYAILRIGPYVCAEWNYGGFPVWLHNIPGIELRTKNQVYLQETQTFTTLIVNMMKKEKLFANQGGPIIIAQIENEYGNIMDKYGQPGKEYVQWCANLALSYNLGLPWIMCQQKDTPKPLINTCNGWYCDGFTPNNKNSPKMWTENWTGWFKGWGKQDPHRTAEDLAFAVARFYQFGGTFQNYYMYHGGTNFGRTSGGPYISTTYDYDAPLDEYGNLNQPKWGHLKKLHEVLYSIEDLLTMGSVRNVDYGNYLNVTIYSYEGKSACFFGNANSSSDATFEFQNHNYTVPAWSVSILPDCYTEVYNTAKVNAQTSKMVKKENQADNQEEPFKLKWEWMEEPVELIQNGVVVGSTLTAKELLDQKVLNDTSDYIWYITSVNITEKDLMWGKDIKIQVTTKGHILHVFVNGKHVGSQHAENGHYDFIFEQNIKLNLGLNQLALLSVTVGYPNYGSFFDTAKFGIHGPVDLIATAADTTITMNLSTHYWIYKAGLHGERMEVFNPLKNQTWNTDGLPTNKLFVWYKTTFEAPIGFDPVVVDLMGLGKGHAWVNGNSLGRYWPAYLANENGCSESCNYRGSYSDKKCLTNCGKPSQRWYHVPRSFLQPGNNTLILFEEFGGNPYNVKFQTVTVGKICANAYEGNTLELSCQGGHSISKINFASFGTPEGTCGSFKEGSCESENVLPLIKQACIGKESCSMNVTEAILGPTSCKGKVNRLAVEAACSI